MTYSRQQTSGIASCRTGLHFTVSLQVATMSLLLSFSTMLITGCGKGISALPSVVAPSPSPNLPATPPPNIVVQPATPSVIAGGTDQLVISQGSASASGQWFVQGGSVNGTIDSNGLYQAPATAPTPNVISAGYILGSGQSFTTTISVSNPNIVVQPATPSVIAGGTDQLVISQGSASASGQWFVQGGSVNGTIDSNGLYQAPATAPTPNVISAGYILGSGQSFTTTISVSNPNPVISSIVPATLTSLSTPIQVIGSGFVIGDLILVDGAAVTTAYIDSSHLSATVVLPAAINQTHQITIQDPESTLSAAMALPTSFSVFDVQPAVLAAGPINLTITGTNFTASSVVTMAGDPLATTVLSSTQITATGYLPPWSSGNVLVSVIQGEATATSLQPSAQSPNPLASRQVPVASTKVTYDAAARFTTQAAFGPRPGLIEHIQSIGFDAYIAEQFQQAPVLLPYNDSRHAYLMAAVQGNALLRQRVASALQSFIVPQWRDFDPSGIFIERKMQAAASGNFRQLLTDIVSDPNIGTFLNLANNTASANPNQNFGRELMQLFTIGPVMLNDDGSVQLDQQQNPIPSYDQGTVLAMTRALTGWVYPHGVNAQAISNEGIDYSLPLTAYENGHDHGAKVLFGTTLPAGATITSDRDAALDILFNHPNLPAFVGFRLIQRLVTSNPSPAYISRVSSAFENNGRGVRGDMTAVVRAILLDPEARKGDTNPSPNDGFLQEPLLFQLFAMNALQDTGTDDQIIYASVNLGESLWNPPTVFGFINPAGRVPGTSINSPEFGMFTNISLNDRSGLLWGMITSTQPGYTADYTPSSWLFRNFKTVPTMVEAVNHLAYHGTMSAEQKGIITSYAAQASSDRKLQLQSTIFLALNASSYTISH